MAWGVKEGAMWVAIEEGCSALCKFYGRTTMSRFLSNKAAFHQNGAYFSGKWINFSLRGTCRIKAFASF